jgi:hypothetical protein
MEEVMHHQRQTVILCRLKASANAEAFYYVEDIDIFKFL